MHFLLAWLVVGRIAISPESPRGRLRELVASMRATHGGPAYVSDDALEQALHYAEDLVKDDEEGNECSEEAYASACAWIMRQLGDPMASHLRPTQAIAARERFHGRASLGLTLQMQLVPTDEDGGEGARGRAKNDDGCAIIKSGPSFWFRRWSSGWRRAPVVTDISEGSPAARAGIRCGDELVEVCGQPCTGPTRSVAMELLESGVEGSAISLTCLRRPTTHHHPSAAARGGGGGGGGGDLSGQRHRASPASGGRNVLRTVRMRREAVPPATVRTRDLAHGSAHLLVISSFGSTTANELRAALRALRRRPQPPPATLVFDLRGNEGGLLPEAIAACRMLIPMGGHVVSLCKEAPPRVIHAYRRRWWHKNELPSRGSGGDIAMSAAAAERTPRTTRTTRRASRARGGEAGAQHGGEAARAGGLGGATCVEPHEQQQRPTDGEKRVHTPGSCAPLVVLVNDASASSAEVFAGALAHAAGAQIIGTRTYGKGSSQAVVYQPDGYAVSFTAYTLSVGARRGGKPLCEGVEPDVPWHWRAPRSVRAANDAEVERALNAAAAAWRRARDEKRQQR